MMLLKDMIWKFLWLLLTALNATLCNKDTFFFKGVIIITHPPLICCLSSGCDTRCATMRHHDMLRYHEDAAFLLFFFLSCLLLFFSSCCHTFALLSAGAANRGESKRSNWLRCVSALAQGLTSRRGVEIKEPWEDGAGERNKPIKNPWERQKEKKSFFLGTHRPALVAQTQVLAITAAMILTESGHRRSYTLVFPPRGSAKVLMSFINCTCGCWQWLACHAAWKKRKKKRERGMQSLAISGHFGVFYGWCHHLATWSDTVLLSWNNLVNLKYLL